MLKNTADKKSGKIYNKNIRKYLLFFILTIIFSSLSFISAAGVSTPYWNTNPLKLQPGESTTISLGLQNMVGTDDITLRASINKGSEIARITDSNTDYLVPIGSSDDVNVNIEIKIPPAAEVDKTQNIEVSFLQVSQGDQGGFFTLASAFTQRIPVLVVGEPTESAVYQPTPPSQKSNLLWTVLALVVLGIIIVAVTISKRRKQ